LWLTQHALRKGTNYRSRFGIGSAVCVGVRSCALVNKRSRAGSSVMLRMSKAWLHIYTASFSSMPANIYAGVDDDCDAAERFDLRSTSAEISMWRDEMDRSSGRRTSCFGHGDPASECRQAQL
jgi:hypothetical protein